MAEFNMVFKRTEKKYMLTEEQHSALMERLPEYMTEDEYGLSAICNIYYDTENFDLIRRSLDKPQYKEKLRLRSYGIPGEADNVFLEIKKKYDGIVYKRRVSMSLLEAESYISGKRKIENPTQIQREIDYFMSYYKPEPKVYLAYDRRAYFGNSDSSLRLTIDKNIRSRTEDLSLALGDSGKLLLPKGQYLMELKLPGAMPLWMVSLLSELGAIPCSFSKYGAVYKNLLEKKEDTKCFRVFYKLPQIQAQASPSKLLQPAPRLR